MDKSTVQVCVRTRPAQNFPEKKLQIDANTISAHLDMASKSNKTSYVSNLRQFQKVLHETSQEEVYTECAHDIVESVLEGYNGTLMAYGQTGAGKTYTITGGSQSYQHRGIVPRALAHVFEAIANKPELAVVVRISYLEIYNETFYDLLQDEGGLLKDLAVVDDPDGNVLVKGLQLVIANGEEEALNLLFQGETNRSVGEHLLNKNSSRSHCIFTVHLEMRSRVESSEKILKSKLNIVDLAGSERVKKTGSVGKVLSEAKFINKSLSFLEQVVIALTTKSRTHVPFRQSKLTNVLRDSLGGNCKTRLIANVWPEATNVEETVSTLKFASRMMRVNNEARINVQLDPQLLIKKYEREIQELKQELQMHDTLANRTGVTYEPYSAEEQMSLQKTVARYIKGELVDMPIESLRQMLEICRYFRALVCGLQGELRQYSTGQKTASAEPEEEKKVSRKPTPVSTKQPTKEASDPQFVGEVEAGGGFHFGQAAGDARPAPSTPPKTVQPRGVSPAPPGKTAANVSFPEEATVAQQSSEETKVKEPPDETVAFEEFKASDGKELHEAFLENKNGHKKRRHELKALSLKLNETKKQIDTLSLQIQTMRRKREEKQLEEASQRTSPPLEEEVEVIDEEEFALIRECRDFKKHYQQLFQERGRLVNEIQYMKGLVRQSKLRLANSFLEWFKEKHATAPEEEPAFMEEGEHESPKKERVRRIEDPASASFNLARKAMKQRMKQKRRGKSRIQRRFV